MPYTPEMIAYFIFLATTLLGFVGAAWWVIAAPVLLLTALRHSEHLRLSRQYARVGELRVMLMAIGLSVLNNSVFASLSFTMGRTFAWIFA